MTHHKLTAKSPFDEALKLFIILSVIVSVLLGCNDSPTEPLPALTDPTGRWLIQFTELIDECDVLEPEDEGLGFVSEQLVTQSGDVYTVAGDELVFGFIDGTMRAPNSLVAEDSLTGDIFGVGFSCTVSERLAYNDITETSANIVYEVVITCEDGTRCDSLFRAYGERIQENS
ncbi:MAG: hypothetical protein ACO3XO_10090 [Bdellovibrionota bacterium]